MSKLKLPLCLGLLAILSIHPIHRLLYPVTASLAEEEHCEGYPLPYYHLMGDGTYNSERGAHDYAFAAVAAWDVYDFGFKEKEGTLSENVSEAASLVTLSVYDPAWVAVDSAGYDSRKWKAGLDIAVFRRETEATRDVLVAIRGTEELLKLRGLVDWVFGNLSWFTQVLPVANQYDVADAVYDAIQQESVAGADGRQLRFLVVGHSLGGGVAHHLATGFPCTSAVKINASPVLNSHYFPQIRSDNQLVHLYDSDDILSSNARKLYPETDMPRYRTYPQEVMSEADGYMQHSSLKMAVGMLRTVAECQYEERAGEKNCIPSLADDLQTTRAAELYCRSFGNQELNDMWKDGGMCKLP